MAFKTFAALALLALAALAPVQETQALALSGVHGSGVGSRALHSSLTRRQNKSGKRCSKYRNGKKPQSSSSSSSSSSSPPKSATKTSTHQDPPKTTHTPVPTKAPTPNYKAGMIFTQKYPGFLKNAQNAVGGKLLATYNWGARRPQESIDAGVEFIPTLWGWKTVGDWDIVKKGYAKRVFGCNEVNQDGQSTMSPSDGVKIWEQYMRPLLSEGIQLYSHSVSNAPSGFDWYDEFFRLCPRCKEETSALNLHYYSNNADYLIAYVKEAYERYKLPIFISEMGCANWSGRGAVDDGCDEQGVIEFIRKATSALNGMSYVVGYTYFGYFPPSGASGGVPPGNALYTENGGLSAAGREYLF